MTNATHRGGSRHDDPGVGGGGSERVLDVDEAMFATTAPPRSWERIDAPDECVTLAERQKAPAFVGHLDGRTFRVRLVLISGVALVIKVAYVVGVTSRERLLLFGQGAGRPRLGRTLDEYYYRAQAIALAHGKGFVVPFFGYKGADAGHPPLTAVLVAPVARFTDNDIALRLPVAFAGAAVVGCIGIVAAQLAGRRAGLICAVLAAVYPNLWVHDGLLMAETLAALAT